jgi:hypothetical protein
MSANWWEKKGGAPNGPMGEENRAGGLDASLRDGIGIGFVSVSEAGLFPLFLSSPFSARNFRQADDTEIWGDIFWAALFSVIVSSILAYYLQSGVTIVWGVVLALALSCLYALRGNLFHLPWHIPVLTPRRADG